MNKSNSSNVRVKRWIEVGRSQSSKIENKNRTQVLLDDYYVVIGFEVNNPNAFKNKVHDLAIDYGHAFFYIVKNKLISMVFSFGPGTIGKFGWFNDGGESKIPAPLKDGYSNSRLGTADYEITEPVKAFKIKITAAQGAALEAATKKARDEIFQRKIMYTAYVNDTCAETAKEVLSEAEIDNPSGLGLVKHSGILPFTLTWATNPYMWHHELLESGAVELKFSPPPGPWVPPVGAPDPIFGGSP